MSVAERRKQFFDLFLVAIFASLTTLSQLSNTAHAQRDGSPTLHAMNNYQQELTDCSVYYSLTATALERSSGPEAEGVKKAEQAADRASDLAFEAGQLIDMKTETMVARMKLSAESMRDEMDGSFVNYSILLNKYKDDCNEAVTDPRGRFEHWVDQISE